MDLGLEQRESFEAGGEDPVAFDLVSLRRGSRRFVSFLLVTDPSFLFFVRFIVLTSEPQRLELSRNRTVILSRSVVSWFVLVSISTRLSSSSQLTRSLLSLRYLSSGCTTEESPPSPRFVVGFRSLCLRSYSSSLKARPTPNGRSPSSSPSSLRTSSSLKQHRHPTSPTHLPSPHLQRLPLPTHRVRARPPPLSLL